MTNENNSDGDKMRKRKIEPLTVAFAVLMLMLLLKALGILKAYFNIDPNGITLSFDFGYLTSAGLFILLWHKFDKDHDKLTEQLTKQGERISKIEGKLEASKSSKIDKKSEN